jgi:integrase/recombinase XerD
MSSVNHLPSVQVISLIASHPVAAEPQSRKQRGKPRLLTRSADIRWPKVQEYLNSNNLAPNSRKVYERELRRFLGWTELLWGEIKPRHIAQYKAYLLEAVQSAAGKSLSKSSVNSAIAVLKSFFGWLSRFYPELISTNPTAGVKFEKISIPPAQSLTPEQMQSVWEALKERHETQQRDTMLIHLLIHGLRAGEIVSLNVGAFDGRLLLLADTKTDEPRLVPLREESQQVLRQYLTQREAQGETLALDRPLILSHHVTRQGERLSYHGIYFAIEKLGELAGIPDLHPHQFRHTYATELLRSGVDPMHARKLTGHKSDKAFKRYTLRSEQEAAIAAFYRAIGEETPEIGES